MVVHDCSARPVMLQQWASLYQDSDAGAVGLHESGLVIPCLIKRKEI